MKRHVLRLLRLLLAVAGLAYIIFSLTWADRVTLPAGMTLPDGTVLAAPVEAGVVSGTLDPQASGEAGPLLVALPLNRPEASADRRTIQVDRARLGPQPGQVHVKPGLLSMLRDAQHGLLALGLLLVGLMPAIQAGRWYLLMRCRGLDPGFGRVYRLTMVGLFFNLCFPGMTGGDVVKSYYAARGSGRGSTAVMSVVFDRLTGMLGLVLLAALVGLTMLEHAVVGRLILAAWLGLLGLVIAGGLYFSDHWRLGLGRLPLLGRLRAPHLLARLDQAGRAYRGHPWAVWGAVLVSLPAHLAQMLATALAGWALGVDVPLSLLLSVLPVVYLAGALPISYQGLGVMEAVAMVLLADPSTATANQVLGMLLLGRLFVMVYALLGSTLLLRGDIHLFPGPGAAEAATSQDVPAKPVAA